MIQLNIGPLLPLSLTTTRHINRFSIHFTRRFLVLLSIILRGAISPAQTRIKFKWEKTPIKITSS
ncbi:hypothetical protein B1R32_1104 [Abditibacterium utsteinense]|uniref:Uncharacterized protein n=1 Tax=Abditibacterium utsteinense TaxID=1960156 RepID=A0A2S8SRV8_9BACT|nr:hypothetical protein [Abditibacterium utsteinense]PQV63541.1 hypothetical protein B1R32_1104 [Abditibacterium utsteinense]